jgi:FtsP/CotA-like multicopper oxidase with cupredoxin domain
LSTLNQRTWDFDYDGGLWTINGLVMDPNRIDAGIVKNSAEIWTFRNTGNDWSHPVHIHFTEFIILEVNGKPYPHDGFTIQEVEDGKYIYVPSQTPAQTAPTGIVKIGGRETGNGLDFPIYHNVPFSGEEATAITPVAPFMGGPRRDVVTILPGDQIKTVFRFMDFEGRHVMHCHNVVHEDHAMMIRWDILPESQTAPINESVPASQVWQAGLFGETSTSDPNQRPYTFSHQESHPAASKDIGPSRGSGNFPPQAPQQTSPNYHTNSQ